MSSMDICINPRITR